MKEIILKQGKEASLKRFHNWIFSGAIKEFKGGEPLEGEEVIVYSNSREFLAVGHYQKGSIMVRILSFTEEFLLEDGLSLEFWENRIKAALLLRKAINNSNSYRLIHGEGDFLPGLIIDYYDGVAVLQAHSAGMYLALDKITEALKTTIGKELKAVYNKSEGTAPFKAGLDLKDEYLYEAERYYRGEREIFENDSKFLVNWEEGQKTGFFLDQRENRFLVKKYAKNKNVLNLFCYTGGFSIAALAAGAEKVVSVDSSRTAIEMLEKNIDLNFSEEINHTSICCDAIEYLSEVENGEFDLMIVDPPAFAKHKGSLDNALRAYKRLNVKAIEKIAPGGIIFTFSCSQVVDSKAFGLAIFSAAAITGRKVRIIGRISQPLDHPVNIFHPESEYFKGLILYVE